MKLVDVHPSNISLRLLLVEIFISLISAKKYHGQPVATSVLCGAHPFASYIRLLLGSILVNATSRQIGVFKTKTLS